MANKAIDVVLDTETLYGYVLDYIGDEWNGYELSGEQVEGAADKIVEASTDGRLRGMIGEVWSTWVGRQFNDAVYDACIDFIKGEMEHIMSKEG